MNLICKTFGHRWILKPKPDILSNIGDAMEIGVRGQFPALDKFTHHTFSHRLGIAKPDAAIYQHVSQLLTYKT